MLSLYYNPETGPFEDLETAKSRLCDVADGICILIDKNNDCKANTMSPLSQVAFCKVKDDISHTIATVFNQLSQGEKSKVKILLHVFNRAECIREDIIGNGTLNLEELDVPSPFLEFALIRKGIAVSISDEPYWNNDKIKFINHEKILPNIWSSTSVPYVEKWIDACNKQTDPLKYLCATYNIKLCCNIKSSDFSSDEWGEIFKCILEAERKKFIHDGNLIKKFEMHTNYGNIHEMRFMSCGLRFFFIYYNNTLYLGGAYRKGQGDDKKQGEKAKQSKQKIVSYINNEK